MRFIQIPNIDSVWDNVKIKTLSPSTFSWVSKGCGYQVLLQKAIQACDNKSLSLPSNQNAILGTIIHKLYELTLKGELLSISDLKNKWEELITIEKDKLTSNYPTLHNASLNDYNKRNSAIRYAMSMMRNNNFTHPHKGSKKIYSEKELYCPELGLYGIADKVIVDGNYCDIIDFKSGKVKTDNEDIKTEYIIQLHLYAAMCKALSLGKPRSLALIDVVGQSHKVQYDSDYCDKLLSEIKQTLQLLNNTIKSKSFAPLIKPDLGMCAYCSCRHVCQFKDIPKDSYYQTINGMVISIPSSNMYVLANEANEMFVSGIDFYNVENPKDYIGKNLIFVNVARSSQLADDYTYKITENTLVYEQL